MNTTEPQELQLVKQDSPVQLMRVATDVAGVSRDIVMKTAVTIQGRKYVRVEGWQAIALAHGCVAGSRDVEKIEGGYRAIGEVKRMSDGMILSTAEGFVGMDETKTWGQRPEYACRAMAQTRAISRACRSAFAHVVVLIDSNLSTTPAEEVPDDGFDNSKPVKAVQSAPQATPAPNAPPQRPAAAPRPVAPVEGETIAEDITLTDFQEKSGTTAAGKPWTLWGCTFTDANGSVLKATTFDKKIGENLDTLKGQECRLRYKPGRKEGSFDIVMVELGDSVPF